MQRGVLHIERRITYREAYYIQRSVLHAGGVLHTEMRITYREAHI